MAVQRYNNSLDAVSQSAGLDTFTHLDYRYYHRDWTEIRDAIAGERRIKEKGGTYLPSLDSNYGTEYDIYASRAIWVNMVARTVLGLVGTVFRRPLKVEGAAKTDVQNVTLDGLDLNLFAKKLAYEICSVGRVGILVDMIQGSDVPYMTEYIAENILSWRTQVIKGREVLTYVLLREIVDDTPALDGTFKPSNSSYINSSLRARYRVLILDNGVYKQRVYSYDGSETDPSFLNKEYKEYQPTRNGKPFDYIPMVIIGPNSPTPEVQKSPVYDIVTLNYAHYRTSAQLEHGRYHTALPVYYVPKSSAQDHTTDYLLGPSVVWEVPPGEKPGILEFYGTGLKTLADSLVEKEEHIAQLGGRIMGIRPQASNESDNIFKMKQANEMSILLNITDSMAAGLTQALKWYQFWQRKSDSVRVKINQDFKALQIAARELRAFALLYQEGILPIQAVFDALQEAEFISDEWTLEDFTNMLNNLDNFPNQPDVAAMHEGYPDATSKLLDEQSQRSLNAQDAQAEMDRQHQALIDQRRAEQQSDLQTQMFKQGKVTQQFEFEQEQRMANLNSKNKIKEQKAAPKQAAPKPGVKPVAAARKPVPKKTK